MDYKLAGEFWNYLSERSEKSFIIAEKAGISLLQQQELLILQNENSRLNYLIEHFNNPEKKYTTGWFFNKEKG